MQSIKEAENQDLLDELAAEVWEESGNLQPATDLEREKYKREARQLLKRIEHKNVPGSVGHLWWRLVRRLS